MAESVSVYSLRNNDKGQVTARLRRVLTDNRHRLSRRNVVTGESTPVRRTPCRSTPRQAASCATVGSARTREHYDRSRPLQAVGFETDNSFRVSQRTLLSKEKRQRGVLRHEVRS